MGMRGIFNMDTATATSWIDVLLSIIVICGLFGVLANLVYFYDKGH